MDESDFTFLCKQCFHTGKKTNIYKDVAANADSMTLVTMNAYLNALEKLFVIEDIDAWCPAIRSATTIRAGEKDVLPIHLFR